MNKIDIKSMTIGVLLCFLILITMSFKSDSEHITCRSVTIINSEGEEIGYLGASTSQSGIIYLNNQKGNQVAYLGTNKDGGGLVTVSNYMNQQVAYLGEDKGGNGLLNLSNKYGYQVLGTGSDSENHDGMISINNSRGKLRGRMTIVDDSGIIITVDSRDNVSGSIPR